ncbi:unnamed protein product [Eruca vesicaria subsp. sativa]|uniref:F-box domain-containing protein n=1 Tax=Eruca vesicaria subsp. sativa TaxID=29727 RepID=A0ABC8JHF0_ERUVS|nr:unnamed protein product [Eruca vesicaria subsp. sativa]
MSDRERDGVTTTAKNPSHREIKRARDSMNGVDFISSLPDAILQHIFSLIPTKYAIRTSVLSKRWKHVWYETPSLNLDCDRYDPDSVIETLSRYYTSPKITSFHLTISPSVIQIKSLLELAMSRNTENLSLRFSPNIIIHLFPEVFFNSCSLKQLFIEDSYAINAITGNTVSWTSLKTLYLRFCLLPDETCAKILSGAPLLESLTLLSCEKLARLDLSKSLKLKRLEIEGLDEPIKIVAPHLRFLKLSHSEESQCDLVDVSSLTEAEVNMYGHRRHGFVFDEFGDPETGLADSFQIMILDTLDKLQNVEKLTLSEAFCLQILSLAVLGGAPFPMFKKLEALTIETAIYQSIIPGVAKLLQNSPRLKTIKLDIVDCNNTIKERRLVNYLYSKYLYTNQCWKPKHLDDPSFSEPKLMTSVMKFLLNTTSGDDKVGSFTFSQNKNSIFCHGLNSRLSFCH